MQIRADQQPDVLPSELGWKAYETYVFGSLQRLCPGTSIRRNVHVRGTKTGKLRQIDVLVERKIGDLSVSVAFDCKCYKRKVTVNDVDRFLGMLDDIRVSKGVLVTTKGYSKTAYRRAQHESRDIELRILAPERLSEFQHIGVAIPWREPFGAVVSAPEGWVADNQPSEPMLFAMYPLGHTRDSAVRSGAFLYGNIFLKNAETPTMEAIAEEHEADILEKVPDAKFHRLKPIARESWSGREPERTLFRVGHIHEGYGGPKYSLYIDHPKGVLLLVLLCPKGEEKIYVPVLQWIGEKALMMDCVDTRSEWTHEVLGRISAYWNRARYVQVFERSAPNVPWKKVREFVEILEPFRPQPQPRAAGSKGALVFESCEFVTVIIPTDGITPREVPGEGWMMPLWDAVGSAPKPKILLRFRGMDETAEVEDPSICRFMCLRVWLRLQTPGRQFPVSM